MYWRGKIIGFLFGLLLFRSMGAAIIGLLMGHYFDKGLGSPAPRTQQLFLDLLFSVMGYIAKSDGRVSEREIHIARAVMSRLNLDDTQRKTAMLAFSRGKESDFSVETAISELQTAYAHQPSQIKLFFTLQMEAAYADSALSMAKQQALQYVGQLLGFIVPIMGFDFGRGAGQQQYSHHRHQQSHARPVSSLSEDYAVLNMTPSASDADIKKAYRKLMSQHHPDKLASKGLSSAKLKQATEKTQQIKAAYDRVRASRGM